MSPVSTISTHPPPAASPHLALLALPEAFTLPTMLPLLQRSSHPMTQTEDEAKAMFLPTKNFSLSCIYAELLVDTFLCGVYTMMLIRYIRLQYHKPDIWWIRLIVLVISFFAYFMTGEGIIARLIPGYIIWFVCYHFVQHFGFYVQFYETDKLSWFPLLDSMVSGITQGFFAHRAFRLMGRNWIILFLVWAMILAAFGAALATKIKFASFSSMLMANLVSVEMLVWLSATMTGDVIITVSILWGLLRSRTGWNHTDKTITRLIQLTFESQVPPLILATAFVIEFSITPASYLGATFQGIQSKLYCVGLLYSLNARTIFAHANGTMVTMDRTDAFGRSGRQQATIHVEVETETYATGVNRRLPDLEKIEDSTELESVASQQGSVKGEVSRSTGEA